MAIVVRLLRGEPLELVAPEVNVSIARLSEWRERALAGAATPFMQARPFNPGIDVMATIESLFRGGPKLRRDVSQCAWAAILQPVVGHRGLRRIPARIAPHPVGRHREPRQRMLEAGRVRDGLGVIRGTREGLA